MAKPVIIVPYNPDWPEEFERIKAFLLSHLGDLLVAVEHIGSTSVPGLAAKPIIDVNMVMESYDDFPAIAGRLKALGYDHEGDLGIEGREVFRQPPGSSFMDLHLYCSPEDSAALLRHLQFRDYLRNHTDARDGYATLKITLAERFRDDRVAYTDAKTAFVQGILARCTET